MNVITKICETIEAYIDLTLSYAKEHHFAIFRGQTQESYKLIPGIARTIKMQSYSVAELLKIEQQVFEQFRILCNAHITGSLVNKQDQLEILSLAQHYELPTRLLDWTSNPLAALFFALKEVTEEEKEGYVTVWTYSMKEADSRVMNLRSSKRQDPFSVDGTFIFKPKTVTPRIAVQAGWFTLHHCHPSKGFIPLEENEDYQEALTRIHIPKHLAMSMRTELDILHINSSTLFPEITGTTQHLRWKIFKDHQNFG